MKTSPSRQTATGVLSKHYVEILTIVALLFVVQTGLVPYDFFRGSPSVSSDFFAAMVSRFTLPDVVSNIFLYLPLGVLLDWCLRRRRWSRMGSLLVTVVLAALLSGAIEWIQAYSPTRVSSIIDLTSNIIGAAMGALVADVGRWVTTRLLAAAFFEACEQPRSAAVRAYAMLLIVVAVMPFSFVFDSGGLKRAVKGADIVPLASVYKHAAEARTAEEMGDATAYAHARWRLMKTWSRWTAEWLAFVVFAWMLFPWFAERFDFNAPTGAALVLWVGGCLAVGMSVLQLLVLTRGFDVTDILVRGMGLAVGLAGRWVWSSKRTLVDRSSDPGRLAARAACALTISYIVYTGLIPLTLGAGAVSGSEFFPFFGYFFTRFDVMMDDAMEKIMAYSLLAALLVAGFARLEQQPVRSRIVSCLLVALPLATLIEAVQVYIPVRVASLTDLCLAAGGCVIGVVSHSHVSAMLGLAQRQRQISLAGATTPTGQLSATDALIASLMDPRPDQPKRARPPRPISPQSLRRP